MLMLYLSLVEGDDRRALFTEFYHAYKGRLYAVALSILKDPALAEEAVQETFLRIVKHFEVFFEIYQNRRDEIRPWAVRIVKNLSLDILKKENRGAPLPEYWDEATPEDVESQSGYRALVASVAALPDSYREALELKLLYEWSDLSIARKLGLSEGAVKMRISRGRELLVERLKEEGYERGYSK